MHTVSFVFKPGTYDEEFHTLDSAIEAFAVSMDGYIGVERWVSIDGNVRNSVYYWRDMASVREFSRFEQHLEAKENYRNWYDGYHIVISEVTAQYGDGGVESLSTLK